jgi:hypothetical protein
LVLSAPRRWRWASTASCANGGPGSTRIRLAPRDKVSRSSNASAAAESLSLSICNISQPHEVPLFDMQRRRRRQWNRSPPNACRGAQATATGSPRGGKLVAQLRLLAWSTQFGVP